MSPSRRRAAVEYLVRRHKVSQRRACRVVGQHRSTHCYVGQPPDFEKQLVKAMCKLAEAHPRYGYRRIHALLVRQGWDINVKRVERLWRAEGLRVPPRRRFGDGAPFLGRSALDDSMTRGSADRTGPRREAGSIPVVPHPVGDVGPRVGP